MKRALFSVLLVTAALMCGCRSVEVFVTCPAGISDAALLGLMGKLPVLCNATWSPANCTPELVTQERASIAKMRAWVNTLHDRCVKVAYLDWLAFTESQIEGGITVLKMRERVQRAEDPIR